MLSDGVHPHQVSHASTVDPPDHLLNHFLLEFKPEPNSSIT
jgi:hypothetical protein